MSAFAKRVKVKPKYDPYPHENTHVHLPDGSHHVVEKTAIGRSSDVHNAELKALTAPWEKDAILEQATEQKTKEWAKFVSTETPLDKGGLRATRSSVDPSRVQCWDTFEIAFDRADVDTPEKQKGVFEEVTKWAKEIHTEGLEGGRRAFSIQEWHGLDGSSSRPHLRLEIQRIGWEPTPALIPTPGPGNRQILKGKVQRRLNYGENESGETDKDFQPLAAALFEKFGIEMQIGAPSQEREAAAKDVSSIPVNPGQEADRVLTKLSATPAQMPDFDMPNETDSLAQLDKLGKAIEASTVAGVVTKSSDPDKAYELRQPVDPFREQVEQAFLAAQAAQKQFDMLRAAQLVYSQNDQLKTQVREQGVLINDLQTDVLAKDTALVERDQALVTQTETIVQQSEVITTQKAALEEATATVESLSEDLQRKDLDLEGVERKFAAAIDERDMEAKRADKAVEQLTETQGLLSTVTTERDTLTTTLATTKAELDKVVPALDAAVRERDEAKERNHALTERNGELLGENKVLTSNMAGLTAERDTAKSELKLARDELAPVVAENAELKAEKVRLVAENKTLIHDIAGEQERRNRLLGLAQYDHETLDAKITRANEIYDKLQQHLGHDPQGLKLLQEVSDLVKPKADYVSRVDAYTQAGMPLKEDAPAYDAFMERVKEVHSLDGEFGQTGRKVALAASKSGQGPVAPKGPKPNPREAGNLGPRPGANPKDPTDRNPG